MPAVGVTQPSLDDLGDEHRRAIEAALAAQREIVEGRSAWKKYPGGARYLQRPEVTFIPTGYEESVSDLGSKLGGWLVFAALGAFGGAISLWEPGTERAALGVGGLGLALTAIGVALVRRGNRADRAREGRIVYEQGCYLFADALLVRGGGELASTWKLFPRDQVLAFTYSRRAGRTSSTQVVYRDESGEEHVLGIHPLDLRGPLDRWRRGA